MLKNDFFSRTDPSIFTSIAPVLVDRSNETSWVFPAFISTSYFLSQSTVSCRSDSSSEANSSCCHISDAWSHLEYRIVSSAQIEVLQIASSERLLMYSKKSVGRNIKPCRTQALTGYCCENFPFITTRSPLLLRKEEMRPNIWPQFS